MTDLTNTAPKRIYLDIGDQFALERVASGDLRWDLLEGVTWSEDNATSHGIPYVRADLVPTPAASGAAPADTFGGNNAQLIDCINAALSLDLDGCLAQPLGSFGRHLLSAASVRLATLASREASPGPLTDEQERAAFFRHLFGSSSAVSEDRETDVLRSNFSAWSAWCARSELAALASPQVAPAGFKLVPIEPTEQMMRAGLGAEEFGRRAAYQQMLSAAPVVPVQESTSVTLNFTGGVNKIVEEFVEDYEMRGEDAEGRDCDYTPNETEKLLILDAIWGLLSHDEFLSALATPVQVAPIPLPSDATSADFATWLMGSITGGGITEEAVQKWWHDYCLECEATPAPLQSAPAPSELAKRDCLSYELGWRRCAERANRDDLIADIDSPAWRNDRRMDLAAGMPSALAPAAPQDDARDAAEEKA